MFVCKHSSLLILSALLLTSAAVCNARQQTTVDGKTVDASRYAASWTGSLDVGAVRLRLVFHLKPEGETLTATLDSPDQGAKGIPLDEVTLDAAMIRIESKKMKAVFNGKLNATSDRIEGTWSQGGREFPLVLERAVGAQERRRPQTPRPPFAYQVEEVTYPHQTEDFHFAATLTYPTASEHLPAVVLISGSGAQDRDESIFEHKPFAVLADHLTKAGMMVLRVDDRGVGGTGRDKNPQDDTTSDFASDVSSSLAYLRSRKEADPDKIGLIGHSEGALVGAMVAAEDRGVAFLVLLAGPGVPGDELLVLQSEKFARASGAGETEVSSLKDLQGRIFSIIRNQPDIDAGKREARAILLAEYTKLSDEERKAAGSADSFVDQHSAVIGIPWFRYFITYDPKSALSKVTCPVLALTGTKDLQVPPEQNLPRIQQWLTQGHAKDVSVRELPELNHLLQSAKTGLATEYGELEETIAPIALNEISDWLRSRNLAR